MKITELKKPKNGSLKITKNRDGNYCVSYKEILNKKDENRAIEIARIILTLQKSGWKELCKK